MNKTLSCVLRRKWSIPHDVKMSVCTQISAKEQNNNIIPNTCARWNRIIDDFSLLFSRLLLIFRYKQLIFVREELQCRCIFDIWKIWSRTISRFSFSHLSLFKCENNILTKERRQWSSYDRRRRRRFPILHFIP